MSAMFFSGPRSANVSILNVPKSKPLQALTRVLVTKNFDNESIINEQATCSIKIHVSLSDHKSMVYFSYTQGQPTNFQGPSPNTFYDYLPSYNSSIV